MQVMDERCAGLDVHEQTVVACGLTPTEQETHTLSTMTVDVWALADGLVACGCLSRWRVAVTIGNPSSTGS
jgi:hypothetical protein